MTWEKYLLVWRKALTELTAELGNDTGADIVEVALSMSDYTPQQKDQWRRGFQDSMKAAHAKKSK